jgi:hypothetical protein
LTEKPGSINADYVFGRMMKLRFSYTSDTIDIDIGGNPLSTDRGFSFARKQVGMGEVPEKAPVSN